MTCRRSPLSLTRILEWADAYYRRTGRWPTQRTGVIPRTRGVTWVSVAQAMREGLRGLPGGDTLASLLARERGAEPASGRYHRRKLTPADILCWAEAHRRRTGRYPHASSGPVLDSPRETWGAINQALLWGRRGLPGGSSLGQLLADLRGRRRQVS
jgi:hypothetical protein